MTARRPDNIRSSILVRGRSILSMAHSGRQPRSDCPERIHIFAILAGQNESDEIFRHKYQLNCNLRLAIIEHCSTAGALDRIRLLPGEELEGHRADLIQKLTQSVTRNPSHRMRWISQIDHGVRQKIVQFMTDPTTSLDEFERQIKVLPTYWIDQFTDTKCNQLLALRGLLAYGILEHGLTRRHRVDFVINRSTKNGDQKSPVAIPFRACDTPAERSEYAHPDILILFTQLADYDDGLSEKEFKDAVHALLQTGPTAQEAEYQSWFDSSASQMTQDEQNELDSVKKVDVSNSQMFWLMFKYYKYNMKTIDLWHSSLVLPMEKMQFPGRLVSNFWNLADNAQKNVIGFSGTNDNRLLLPLQVIQSTPLIPQLEAANGKMLALFMRKSALTCLKIDQHSSHSDTVLSTAVNAPRCAALIDAEALMAGLSNQQVAEHLSALLTEKNSALKRAVFFDDGRNAWSFRIHTGYIWLLENSPVQEKDAFVYFDESRCRGADMKLSMYVVAALTIGRGMCKDKLMQAAFRMRQLDREQSLNLMLPLEVVTRVQQFVSKEFDNIIPKDVMRWVLKNTVKEITSGLPGWASQGSYYSTTKRDPKLRLLDENLKLTDLYAFPCTDAAVYDVNMQTEKKFLERCPKDAPILH